MTTLIILVLLVGGGFLAYRYLKALEAEIRSEIESPDEPEPGAVDGETDSEPAPASGQTSVLALSERILQLVRSRPGILQKEIYPLLEDADKKTVQQELQNLEHVGRIVRLRSGNSFQLTVKD